jgi:hypothetical protein
MTTPSNFTRAQRATYDKRCAFACQKYGITPEAFYRLCRIEQTLQRWFEEECNGTIQRDDQTGKPYRYFNDRQGVPVIRSAAPIPDLERGAIRRAKAIVQPFCHVYIQTDPRGCAVYLFRWKDVPASVGPGRIDQCYASVGYPVYFPEG